jgi:hypothetical protein
MFHLADATFHHLDRAGRAAQRRKIEAFEFGMPSSAINMVGRCQPERKQTRGKGIDLGFELAIAPAVILPAHDQGVAIGPALRRLVEMRADGVADQRQAGSAAGVGHRLSPECIFRRRGDRPPFAFLPISYLALLVAARDSSSCSGAQPAAISE